MIFKFKNGYQVQIRDCEGKTREELVEIAKKAVIDAVALEKKIDTNVSFMPTKMKEAIAAKDVDKYTRELDFLLRDLEADMDEAHLANYPKTYRKEVLEKLVNQYESAYELVKKGDAAFGTNEAVKIGEYLDTIKEHWDLAEVKPYARIEYANGEVTVKFTPTIDAAYDEIIKRIEAGLEDGNKVVLADIINDNTGEVLKQVYGKNTKPVKDADERNMPKYRVKLTYENGEVTIKYVDTLTEAVEDIRNRIEAGKKDGNKVVVALVFDAFTDEIILSSDRDEDIKIKDAPPPYYDPTDYPQIKSDYSTERLDREMRHLEKEDPILEDLGAVYDEIEELTQKGTKVLIEAGWSKDDARRAIASRYIALEKELRKNKLIDQAHELHTKIRALEKAWDLRV